jgi:hypothetical protein
MPILLRPQPRSQPCNAEHPIVGLQDALASPVLELVLRSRDNRGEEDTVRCRPRR